MHFKCIRGCPFSFDQQREVSFFTFVTIAFFDYRGNVFTFFSSCGNCSKKIRVYNIDKKIKLNCKLCIQPLPRFENFGFFDLQNAKKSCKK